MHVLWRGDWFQRLRLVSGLILFAFATTHFLNHALGLFDLEAMYEVQQWRWMVTRSWPGTIILGGALLVHVLLALVRLASRLTLRLQSWELLQIVLGICIPFLLFPHIVNTRVAHSLFGVNDTYAYELARLWPDSALLQSTLLLLVWVHGCIGIHFWLRLYRPYRRFEPLALFIAIAIPVAALGGFMAAGRAVAILISDPQGLAHVKEESHWPSPAVADQLALYRMTVRVQFAAVLLVVAALLAWPNLRRRYWPQFMISYNGGPVVKAIAGPTLLEISRINGLAHASVCGGRARCSTCRVRVEQGLETLPPAMFPEAVTLASIGAPPNVRLACQIRPTEALTVTRLVRPSTTGPEAADVEEFDAGGVEKKVVVLFLDLRDFTEFAQSKLPYDIVYFLNEFFGAAGSAITAHKGWIDKFLGDGLLAIFGDRDGLAAGCRQALRAARAIDLALDHVNAKMEGELGRPLKVGIGIDAGPLILGRIGFGSNVDLTVIGTAVNVASRLEKVAKEKKVQIVISHEVARQAGWSPPAEILSSIAVRGVRDPVEIVAIGRGRDLPASILAPLEDEEESVLRKPAESRSDKA